MKRWSIVSILVFVCASIIYPIGNISHAQQATPQISLTLSPAVFDITINPGENSKQTFRIRNDSFQPIPLQIRVDKLVSVNNKITFASPNPGDTSTSWLSFDKTTFTALPQQWTNISLTIAVPKDAAFGYYFAVHISQPAANIPNGQSTKLVSDVVLPILLTVPAPGAIASGKLVSFTTPSSFNEYLPINFTIAVKATGNIHIQPHGDIFISNGGNTIATITVNQSFGAVLPGQTRTFQTSWGDGFITNGPILKNGVAEVDSNGNPHTQFAIHWSKNITSFRFGEYYAHLTLAYNNGVRDIPLTADISFWVIPWKLLIGIGIIGLLLLVGVISVGRNIYHLIFRKRKQFHEGE
jgi:hypothetical protein